MPDVVVSQTGCQSGVQSDRFLHLYMGLGQASLEIPESSTLQPRNSPNVLLRATKVPSANKLDRHISPRSWSLLALLLLSCQKHCRRNSQAQCSLLSVTSFHANSILRLHAFYWDHAIVSSKYSYISESTPGTTGITRSQIFLFQPGMRLKLHGDYLP